MKKISWLLFYIFLFSILLYNSFNYLDPDFGWHLRFGEIILHTQSIPHDQIFLWPLQGQNWVDHEWLANAVIYGLWSLGGYVGISIFFALLGLLIFIIINRFLLKNFLKRQETQITLAIIEVAALLTMKPHLGIRVQEITVLGLAILLLTLQQFFIDRTKIPPWWLPILFYIWACSHAGFLIGLLILCLWLCVEIALYFFPTIFSNIRRLSKDSLSQWTIISGISFLVTFFTPYGMGLYSFLSEYRDNFYVSHIQEWLPPYAFPIKYSEIGFIILAISSTVAIYGVLRKKIPPFSYAVILLFAVMALKSVRHFPLLLVAWFILILPYFLPEITARFHFPAKKWLAPLGLICLVALTINFFVATRFTTKPFTAYCQGYPCKASRFLLDHPEYQNNIFNSYNFGGYLIGVAPELRLFIDGRLPQYSFKGHSMLEEYYEFYRQDFTRQKLDEYQIQTVFSQKPRPRKKVNWFEKYILGYDPVIASKLGVIDIYLSSSPNWEKVYEDDLSLIFVRK